MEPENEKGALEGPLNPHAGTVRDWFSRAIKGILTGCFGIPYFVFRDPLASRFEIKDKICRMVRG